MSKIAIYARVSTVNLGQSPEMQLFALKEYCKARGLSIYKEYVDEGISGSCNSRPALNQLMDDARKRKFDMLIVYRFDRFARSTKHLITALEEFRSLGIDFISYSENIDTSSPLGKAVFVIVSAVAELERNIIRERVIAGLKNAQSKGKRLGRPTISYNKKQIVELCGTGISKRAVAKKCGVSHSTILRVLKEWNKTPENITS